jgi:hypothetical protein
MSSVVAALLPLRMKAVEAAPVLPVTPSLRMEDACQDVDTMMIY